jgi:4-hydroxybutyrate CoA-transferase
MKVGVKFCGGCNPRYDRKAELAKALQRFGDAPVEAAEGSVANGILREGQGVSFEYAREGENYDALLVLCGCPNRCASVNEYTFNNEIMIDDAGQADAAAEKILHLAEKK